MFKYGGPIKEGIMHGMKNGGRAALVGNPVYPKTDGREHHAVVSGTIAAGVGLNALRHAAMRAGARYLPKAVNWAKNIFGKTTPATVTRSTHRVPGAVGSYSPVTMNPAKFNPNWLGRDPLVRTIGATGRAIFNPTVGGWAGKAARFATSPSSLLIGGLYYANGRWFNKKGEEVPPPKGREDGPPGGGDPGMFATPKEPEGPNAAQLAAAAKAERTAKLNKYLDTMGYDKAKDTALSNALIDASAIVQDATTEAGSLKKADWSKMINKAIQSTSQRLVKAEQIREAVGLMMTKADIQKDLEDPQVKELRAKQIDLADKQLAGTSFEEIISDRMIKGDMLKGTDLAALLRIKKGIDAKVISTKGMKTDQDALTYVTKVVEEKEGTPYPPGYYVISDRIIEIDEQGKVNPVL